MKNEENGYVQPKQYLKMMNKYVCSGVNWSLIGYWDQHEQ